MQKAITLLATIYILTFSGCAKTVYIDKPISEPCKIEVEPDKYDWIPCGSTGHNYARSSPEFEACIGNTIENLKHDSKRKDIDIKACKHEL